jgi:hypothetical protein
VVEHLTSKHKAMGSNLSSDKKKKKKEKIRQPKTGQGPRPDLWKSSMQWIWLVASTVKGMPSRPRWHTTQVKQPGW